MTTHYLRRELPQVTILSRQTRLLSRQEYACRDKSIFAAYFCLLSRHDTCITKVLSRQKRYWWQLSPMIIHTNTCRYAHTREGLVGGGGGEYSSQVQGKHNFITAIGIITLRCSLGQDKYDKTIFIYLAFIHSGCSNSTRFYNMKPVMSLLC